MHRERSPIWNSMDEAGLMIGMPRIPGETNQEYRQRMLDHPTYDSTRQGLLNWIANGLLQVEYNVEEKTVFTSLRDPLSYSEYQMIEDPAVDYYAPRVIIGATTWTIASTDNEQKDEVTTGGITWTLWKQPDGGYDPIWTTDSPPTSNVELRYMWKDQGGNLVVIRETVTVLSWSDGEVVTVDPDA